MAVLRAIARGIASEQEEIEQNVCFQVFFEPAVLQVRELEAEPGDLSRGVRLQLLQVTYDDSPRQEKSADLGLVEVSRQAELTVVLEPEDVEVAAIFLELLKQALNGMDCMEELEAICMVLSALA